MNAVAVQRRRLAFRGSGNCCHQWLFPAIWILFTSLKTETELFRKPITYLPHAPTLKNYIAAAVDQPLFQVFMKNSVIVALLATVVSLCCGGVCGLRHCAFEPEAQAVDSHGDHCFVNVPLITLLVPIFETMRALGWLNSYLALVFPYVVLESSGLHPGAGQLLPEHPARSGKRGDDRRLHPIRHAVAGGVAVVGAGRVYGRHTLPLSTRG